MAVIRREKMRPQNGSHAERVARYRDRAEELRIIADDRTSLQAKRMLLRLAMTYDDAARQMERIDRAARTAIRSP